MDERKQVNQELIGSNRLVAICGSIEAIIIVFVYLAEYMNGIRTLPYVAGIAGAFILFAVALIATYCKNKESALINI